jgi:hypothetical protein
LAARLAGSSAVAAVSLGAAHPLLVLPVQKVLLVWTRW